MPPEILLAKFRSLLDEMPEMAGRGTYSTEHYSWLAKAFALVQVWNPQESHVFKNSCDWAAGNLNRSHNLATILGTLHRAIAALELVAPKSSSQVFGPGAVYDFFVALTAIIKSAENSLFIIDPYLDEQIFDAYVSSLLPKCSKRMLVNRHSANVKAAAERYCTQHGVSIEVRKSNLIHDRVIFIDGSECWVLGASIKDAADSKPTYLAPLSPDVSKAKFAEYESIWEKASTT